MNPLYRIYCRVYQKILYIASAFLSFREPTLLVGLNSNQRILSILQENGLKRMLLATDAFLATSEPFIRIRQQLETSGIQVTLFSDTLPNPSIQQIETVCSMYRKHDCQGLIAYGGGSVIDLAKVVAAASSNPSTPIRKMRGLLKIRHKLPLLIAIPTTAGTGSEATVAAVVTDEDTKEKYAINDPKLIPKVAILDPINVQGMPFNLAATTGLDALTHAIEAYIGSANTPKTKRMAVSAIKTIFTVLVDSCQRPDQIDLRSQMQLAAYQAGVAFTRAYVGNIHALAHQLGGFYHFPHGLANAILLPVVLRYYGKSVHKKLAGLNSILYPEHTKLSLFEQAEHFILAIQTLNNQLKIPEKVLDRIQEADIPIMASRAFCEANPLYPVPKLFTTGDFMAIYREIM